eukprot:160439_1
MTSSVYDYNTMSEEAEFLGSNSVGIQSSSASVDIQYIEYNGNTTKRSTAKASTTSITILLWISRILPLLAAICAIGLVIFQLSNPDNWSSATHSDEAEKSRRQSERGTFVSILSAILLNIVGAIMLGMDVAEQLV